MVKQVPAEASRCSPRSDRSPPTTTLKHTLYKSGIFTFPPRSDIVAFHISSHCMIPSLTWLTSFAGCGYMHSRRTLKITPSVLLLSFRVESCPNSYSTQSRHAPRDRRRITIRLPRQCTVHFCTSLDALCSVRIRNRLSKSPRRFSDSTRLGCIQQSRQISVHSRHGRLDLPRPTLPLVFVSQERFDVIESSHVQLLLL